MIPLPTTVGAQSSTTAQRHASTYRRVIDDITVLSREERGLHVLVVCAHKKRSVSGMAVGAT